VLLVFWLVSSRLAKRSGVAEGETLGDAGG
jgi:hypothetical protein